MKIVQFDNGKWALRKFSFSELCYVYKDLVGEGYYKWRPMRDSYFHHCLADSEAEVREQTNLLKVVQKVDA